MVWYSSSHWRHKHSNEVMSTSFKSYTAIERKASVMGMALQDILIVTTVFVAFLLLGAVMMIIGIFVPLYFAFVLAVYLISVFLLYRMRPKGQPDFFLAYISFHFKQPQSVILTEQTVSILRRKR